MKNIFFNKKYENIDKYEFESHMIYIHQIFYVHIIHI